MNEDVLDEKRTAAEVSRLAAALDVKTNGFAG